MKTVLSNHSVASNTAQNRLFGQIEQSYKKKAEQEAQAVSDRYQGKINRLERLAADWKKTQTRIGKASSEVATHLGRARSLLTKLDSMINTVIQAKQAVADGDFKPEGYAAAFDSMLRGVESESDRGTRGTNLLGPSEPALSYQTTIYGASERVEGNYLGADYVITDSDGNRWRPDLDARLLRQYDSGGEATGKVGSFSDMQIDSLNGDSISFTIAPDTASPESFSGTIDRKGVQMLNAWAYEGLETSAGRERALEDLNTAKATVQMEIWRYQAELETAKFYEERAATNALGLREDKSETLLEQAKAVRKAQEQLSQEFQGAKQSMQQLLAQRNGYQKFLGGAGASPLAKSLMSVYA